MRASVPVRDNTGRFTGARVATRADARAGPGGGGVFKTAAAEVLRQEKRLMSTGEITRVGLERGILVCNGKTPEATMASSLYTEVKRREATSIFVRWREGLFGLRAWKDAGMEFNAKGEPLEKGAAASQAACNHPPSFEALTPSQPKALPQQQKQQEQHQQAQREEQNRHHQPPTGLQPPTKRQRTARGKPDMLVASSTRQAQDAAPPAHPQQQRVAAMTAPSPSPLLAAQSGDLAQEPPLSDPLSRLLGRQSLNCVPRLDIAQSSMHVSGLPWGIARPIATKVGGATPGVLASSPSIPCGMHQPVSPVWGVGGGDGTPPPGTSQHSALQQQWQLLTAAAMLSGRAVGNVPGSSVSPPYGMAGTPVYSGTMIASGTPIPGSPMLGPGPSPRAATAVAASGTAVPASASSQPWPPPSPLHLLARGRINPAGGGAAPGMVTPPEAVGAFIAVGDTFAPRGVPIPELEPPTPELAPLPQLVQLGGLLNLPGAPNSKATDLGATAAGRSMSAADTAVPPLPHQRSFGVFAAARTSGPAVPTTLVGAPTQVPTLRVTPVPTHQHMAPSQAAAAAAAVRGWAAVAVPAGSGLSDSLGIPGLPSDWSTPPDGMSAGPEATGSSRTCSSGHGSKRNGGALSCLSGGGGLSWTGGMRRLAGASSPTPAGGDSAEGPLKLEGSLPAANDLVPGSSPGGLLRSGSRPLQRIREESSQGVAASGARAAAAGAAPDGSGYSTDVGSIMMLIHAAEELHGGPSAYVEAGITDLDKPITTIRAVSQPGQPAPHVLLLEAGTAGESDGPTPPPLRRADQSRSSASALLAEPVAGAAAGLHSDSARGVGSGGLGSGGHGGNGDVGGIDMCDGGRGVSSGLPTPGDGEVGRAVAPGTITLGRPNIVIASKEKPGARLGAPTTPDGMQRGPIL